MRRRFALLAVAGFALGLAAPLLLGGRSALAAAAAFPVHWLAGMLGMVLLGWCLNAGRLRLLLGGLGQRMGPVRAVATVMAVEFAGCATPGGAGGAVSLAYLLGRQGLRPSHALALYAADQFTDMLFFITALAALAVSGFLLPSAPHLGWQLAILAGLLLAGMALLGLLLHHYRRVLIGVGRLARALRLGPGGRRRLLRRVLEFRQGMRLVQRFAFWRLAAIYLLCSGHWLLRYSILYLAVHGLGGVISWEYSFLVQMLSLTVGQASLLPGGSGGTELGSALLLAPVLGAEMAAAAILVWRFVTFYWYLIAGLPAFVLLAGRPLWRRLASA